MPSSYFPTTRRSCSKSESDQFEKLCALPPPDVLSDEVQAQTVEEIDRIRRMAADGPRVPNR